MLIFKVARFVLKHPLLSMEPGSSCTKNYVPKRRHPL